MEKRDVEIIEKVLSGNESIFSELVEIYLKPVYNFLFQLTSDRLILDDLAQETFIKAWRNLKKFDQSRASFKTWIFTIAKNTAYDHFKKKKAIPFSNFTDEQGYNKLENIADENILPYEMLVKNDTAQILENKLKELPENYRIILILHYQEDFSLSEIAQILKIPYNTAKSQHQRGLVKIRETLTKETNNLN